MRRRFYTSDWHVGHKNIIKYCGRPFLSVPDMNRMMLEKIKAEVTDEDELYVVGDCYMGCHPREFAEWLAEVPGRKILIRGNHDRRTSTRKFLAMGFDEVHKYMRIPHPVRGNNVVLLHDPVGSICFPNDFVICGHVHNLWLTLGRCVNVSVDMWNFWPVPEEEIEGLFCELEEKGQLLPPQQFTTHPHLENIIRTVEQWKNEK